MTIDISILRKLRDQQASMVRYYAETDKKRAQNAALISAGLAPIHSELSLQWDFEQAAERQRYVEVLDAVIEHLGVREVEVAA